MKLVLQIALGIVLAPLVAFVLVAGMGFAWLAGPQLWLMIAVGVGIWLVQKPVVHYLNSRPQRPLALPPGGGAARERDWLDRAVGLFLPGHGR